MLTMQRFKNIIDYLSRLPNGKLVLWCYLLWYINTLFHHFDPSPQIWMNSVGISALIGIALILSVGGKLTGSADKWQTFRLFAMPFCVSSFSSLIKGQGFFLIIPPAITELAISLGLCCTFTLLVFVLRKRQCKVQH